METNRHRSTNSTTDKPRFAAAAQAVAGTKPKRFYREFAGLQTVTVEEFVTLQMHAGSGGSGSHQLPQELSAVIHRELQFRTCPVAGQSGGEVAGDVP